LEDAIRVIDGCRSKRGLFASTGYYRDLWLRDVVFSLESLIEAGEGEVVRRHLETFLRAQREDGRVPAVVASGFGGLVNEKYQPWTSDSEVLLVLGVSRYAKLTADTAFARINSGRIRRALEFTGRRLHMSFVVGSDWRDAVVGLDEEALLSNQMLLVDAYKALDMEDEASDLSDSVVERFSEGGGLLVDSVSSNDGRLSRVKRFDCLGSALAVLNGTAGVSTYRRTAEGFQKAATRFGWRNLYPPYPPRSLRALSSLEKARSYLRNGAFLRNRPESYQNSAVWPFVEIMIGRAFAAMGMKEEATVVYRKVYERKGFNEWYDPRNGKPRGSEGQLWTAAAVLEAGRALGKVESGARPD